MTTNWKSWDWKLALASCMAVGGVSTSSFDCALAQITPDGTLPNNSIVTPQGNTSVISGGTQAGSNLFHSFEEFSAPTGNTAYFNNTPDIQNIISRMTGKSVSNIDGLIRANGNANLFLLNPNGIIFGPNASLNIGGSFLASTASSLNFADGSPFSATAPQTTLLLSVNVPIGLQFGGTAGPIRVQGPGHKLSVDLKNSGVFRGDNPVGLQVQPGKTLALVGGDVALEGGHLIAEGGRIEVGSVAGSGVASLTPTDFGLTLGYSGLPTYGDIQLSQQASLDVSGEGSGDIQLQSRRVTLIDGSAILALTLGSKPGGNVNVNASGSVEVVGTSANYKFPSAVFAYTQGAGDAGSVNITTTGQLFVMNGAQVRTDTFGTGNAGKLSVVAKDVELSGTSANGDFASGLFATTQGNGSGGDLDIIAGQLLVQNGAVASTSAYGAGIPGSLNVGVRDSVKLSGTSPNGQIPSGLFTTTEDAERGGRLDIIARQLLVQNGAVVSASTSGEGNAGSLVVNTSDSVELSGTLANGRIAASGLFAQVEPEATGNGGNLAIKTGQLSVQYGAEASVSSQGSGNAGNLQVAAHSIQLDSRGAIRASSALGNSGNIRLQAEDLLLMRRGSDISTFLKNGTRNNGNIDIDTDLIVAIPGENSDIVADDVLGQGGNVKVTAQGIFGIELRERFTPKSDIIATGTVELVTPDVDPSQRLVELPAVPIDTEVVQACTPGGSQQQSEFIVTGRGGLPPNPGETLSTDAVQVDLITLNPQVAQPSTPAVSTNPTSSTPPSIVEAQGWVIDANGNVVLIANAPNVTPDSSWQRAANCQKLNQTEARALM